MSASGAWVAHPAEVTDASQIGVYSAELNALRDAVLDGRQVTLVPFGKTLAEAIAAKDRPTATPAKKVAAARPEPGAVVGGKKREL